MNSHQNRHSGREKHYLDTAIDIIMLIALVFVVAGSVAALTGCADLQQYDPVTVEQVQATIDEREDDFKFMEQALKDCEAPEATLNELDARRSSEMTRLEKWLKYEKAKRKEDGDG